MCNNAKVGGIWISGKICNKKKRRFDLQLLITFWLVIHTFYKIEPYLPSALSLYIKNTSTSLQRICPLLSFYPFPMYNLLPSLLYSFKLLVLLSYTLVRLIHVFLPWQIENARIKHILVFRHLTGPLSTPSPHPQAFASSGFQMPTVAFLCLRAFSDLSHLIHPCGRPEMKTNQCPLRLFSSHDWWELIYNTPASAALGQNSSEQCVLQSCSWDKASFSPRRWWTC